MKNYPIVPCRVVARDAARLEDALRRAGRDPDDAGVEPVWDAWERGGLAAALRALRKLQEVRS